MKYAFKTVSVVLLLAAFFAFTACGGGGGGSDDPETEKETVIGQTGTGLGSVDMDGDGVSDGTAIDVDDDGTPDGVDTNGDGKIDEEYSEDYTLLDEAMTDAEAVAADKANLTIGYSGSDSSDSVTQNITLATSGSNGTTITWESNDTDVVSTDGTVTRPTCGSGDATVTLTATITKNGVSETKTFEITVKEVPPTLASLTFNKGKLQPAFSAGTTTYLNAPVPFSSEASPAYNDTQSVTVTAAAANSGATITINGTSVASGSAFTMANLDVGKNNATIVVTAQDGVTKTTYTVEVYRAIPIFKTGAADLEGYTFVAGEDGQTNCGVSWPATRFTAVGDDSLRDEKTGLVWLKTLGTSTRTWANAITYCEDLETESGTVVDWRLPNVRELLSLVHYGQSSPATWLNSQGFANVQSSLYFSSTTFARHTYFINTIDMNLGEVYTSINKADGIYLWPILGTTQQLSITGQTIEYMENDDGTYQEGADVPSTRFRYNGDGTVTDNITGLMWVESPDLTKRSWTNAITYCEGLNYAGHSDWRLPTVNEFETLTNYGQRESYTWQNNLGFGSYNFAGGSFYWSGTTYAPNTDYAWIVSMGIGRVEHCDKLDENLYVLPVRYAAP